MPLRIRPVPFALAVTLLTMLGCGGPPQHPTWSNATGAEQYERLMWQAVHAKDWKSFEHRLAPAFVGVDSNGRSYDRAGWVEHWKSAGLAEYSLGEISVQPESVDMVVTYLFFRSASGGAGEPARVISVWQQVKSGWILTACSLTPAKPE